MHLTKFVKYVKFKKSVNVNAKIVEITNLLKVHKIGHGTTQKTGLNLRKMTESTENTK